MTAWAKYAAKALYAAGIALSGTLGIALADGHVSPVEWTVVAGATLAAAGGVFGLTNGPKPGQLAVVARLGRHEGPPVA